MLSDLFPLTLFPPGGLTSSIVTTTWIGVLIVAFFNLRLGWVLSGLVVPGYLVPLLLLKPWSAAVILFEAIITYLLIRFLSDFCSRFGLWHSLFGRDRFFALVLASVIVRVIFDGFLLQPFGAWLHVEWNIQFDYRNDLYSFGLIIIALLANLFWKTGLIRGSLPVITSLTLTYLVVRYVLMPLTNFTISNIGYMYEELAVSILDAPKAYIILLVTALIASRLNLRLGWDYNGILIPSLIAIQWFQPEKVLATFVEAFVILGIAMLALRLPWLANRNIEGARKLVLFFNISFIYKIILGFSLLHWMPGVKITDTYGFGYLLATLMAIKMHDKNIPGKLTMATLITSISGVLLGSMVGLTLAAVTRLTDNHAVSGTVTQQIQPLQQPLIEVIRADKLDMYQSMSDSRQRRPQPFEVESFQRALSHLRQYRDSRAPYQLQLAASRLAQINYRLLHINQRYLYLQDQVAHRHWGHYLIDPDSNSSLQIQVPAPLKEQGSLEAATVLFQKMQAHSMAINTFTTRSNHHNSPPMQRHSLYHIFHREMSGQNVLQLRGYNRTLLRQITGAAPFSQPLQPAEPDNTLYVHRSLPPDLNLTVLQQLVPELDIQWQPSPADNLQRQHSHNGYAELILQQETLRRLLTRALIEESTIELTRRQQRIDGYLQQWLLHSKDQIAPRGSNRYQPPRLWELLFMDEEVLTPLWQTLNHEYQDNGWSPRGREALQGINAAAAVLGYQLIEYHHQASNRQYLILSENPQQEQRRYWGTLVFRLTPDIERSAMIQIPRPLYERNSFEMGVSLFEQLQAHILVIAGAHPDANLDGSADVIDVTFNQSLFTLSEQVILREAGALPMLVIQTRAFSTRPDTPSPNADILLAIRDGEKFTHRVTPLAGQLLDTLRNNHFKLQLVDGSIETAGYEIGTNPQAMSLNAYHNKEFISLWSSAKTREGFQQHHRQRQQMKQFAALNIPSRTVDLSHYVNQYAGSQMPAVPDPLLQEVQHYLQTENIVVLHRLMQRWPDYHYQRLIDLDSQQAYLAIAQQKKQLWLLVNLQDGSAGLTQRQADPTRSIQPLLDQRIRIISFGALP